jgi:hypothetical protein
LCGLMRVTVTLNYRQVRRLRKRVFVLVVEDLEKFI